VREEEVREGGRGEGEVRETSLATEGEPAELRLAGPGRSRQRCPSVLLKHILLFLIIIFRVVHMVGSESVYYKNRGKRTELRLAGPG
jgi:hypothetical protein